MRASRPVRSAALVAALVVGFVFSAGAHAAPGDLDPTFSGDGKQTTDFQFGVSRAAATVRQPDGKIIAVGSVLRTESGDNTYHDFALARYNPNGTLDTSFSGDGKQTTDFGFRGDEEASGVALQADGKIVAVGHDGSGHFALARYNTDGTLDTSFSGDGTETTDLGGTAQASGVALQADGKIVAVGTSCFNDCDFALARYNPDGTLDPSFSGDGTQTTDFGFGGGEEASEVALQADGKIVAVGHDGSGDFALARYNPNGTLDTSFSGDGKQTTDFGTSDAANGVAIQGDGRIVAVGRGLGSSGVVAFALARYNPDGTLDTSFSGDGKQTTDFSGGSQGAAGVAVQGDGKIVAVGNRTTVPSDFALARYNPNGTLDTSFSGDGKQTTDIAGGADGAAAVALQGDGKVVAVGFGGSPHEDFAFALARYNPNGTLDTSFSGDGKLRSSFGGYRDGAAAVALQGDGKIVAVGHVGAFSSDFALARYNPNGTLDTSFSGDGKLTTDFGGGDAAIGVAIQPDGKIVAVGSGGTGFALARYNPNGSLDTTFSSDGKQTTQLGDSTEARGMALQANGKIVVVGRVQGSSVPGGGDFALARYNPNGTLDTSFSGDGKLTTDFGDFDDAGGVVLQGDGKVVAVGYGGSGIDFALARYNPNGTLDTSFSGDGKQTTDFGGIDQARAVTLRGGKAVVVGSGSRGTGGDDFALARYNPNGTLDTTFSSDGKRTTDFGTGDAANGVAVQTSGKIVAVGRGAGSSGYAFAIARYNPNGSLDTSFSGDGKQVTDFGFPNQPGGATGMALQGDGKIVAVGVGVGPNETDDFALARYLGG